jgi:hypothetical protein
MEARALDRVQYPEYAIPTAGMMPQPSLSLVLQCAGCWVLRLKITYKSTRKQAQIAYLSDRKPPRLLGSRRGEPFCLANVVTCTLQTRVKVRWRSVQKELKESDEDRDGYWQPSTLKYSCSFVAITLGYSGTAALD